MATGSQPFVSPWLVAAAGWAVPGLGHAIVGQKWRGVALFAAVASLFVGGLLIGGVRVVDMPGYFDGQRQILRNGSWTLTQNPVGTVLGKPWFIAQSLTGPSAFVAGYGGIVAARNGYPKPTARLSDIGVLYCATAGMMNLIGILDASGRASRQGGKS
ncbi:MAG: DUF6677 family protein [Planctomycetota bacterium]